MIDLDGMISIPYLKKAVFTGSCQNMRFLIRKQSDGDSDKIQAAVWPGPYIFSVTEEEKKIYEEFAFSQDGLQEAIDWLNRQYEAYFSKNSGTGGGQ